MLPELCFHSPAGANISVCRGTTQGTQAVYYQNQVPLKSLTVPFVNTTGYNVGVLNSVQVPVKAFKLCVVSGISCYSYLSWLS